MINQVDKPSLKNFIQQHSYHHDDGKLYSSYRDDVLTQMANSYLRKKYKKNSIAKCRERLGIVSYGSHGGYRVGAGRIGQQQHQKHNLNISDRDMERWAGSGFRNGTEVVPMYKDIEYLDDYRPRMGDFPTRGVHKRKRDSQYSTPGMPATVRPALVQNQSSGNSRHGKGGGKPELPK